MISSATEIRFALFAGPRLPGRKGKGAPLRPGEAAGFTLVEILVATSILLMLVAVLASILNQALGVWGRNENTSDLRESARAAMNRIGSELRQAVLPVYRADPDGLRFVVNPAGVSDTFKNHDALFWQAPVATNRDKGDLATVGYFVRKENAAGPGQSGYTYKLCRLLVNPDNVAGPYGGVADWIDDDLLDKEAPADEASDLKGLFLENVPGMWVTAYSDATTPYPSYDSRVEKKLPARVEISLALLDAAGAQRVASGAITLPEAKNYPDAEEFWTALPSNIKANVRMVAINVSFPY